MFLHCNCVLTDPASKTSILDHREGNSVGLYLFHQSIYRHKIFKTSYRTRVGACSHLEVHVGLNDEDGDAYTLAQSRTDCLPHISSQSDDDGTT